VSYRSLKGRITYVTSVAFIASDCYLKHPHKIAVKPDAVTLHGVE